MKQLLLENPRRRRRVRRNFGRRTPLSPLYRNKPVTTGMVDEAYKGNFDDIFRKRKKTTKKGKKKMAKSRRRRKGNRKGKMPAGLRKYWAMKRKGKKATRRRRKSSTRRTRKTTRRYKRKASASRGMRRRRRGGRRTRRSSVRTITIPRTKTKRRTYTMKIRVNRRWGGANLRGFVSQFTSRENLSLAGGVILAPIVTGFVKTLLPAGIKDIGGAGTKVNTALLSAGIAGLGAILTNRFSPAIAKGMIIGGLATAIREFLPTAGTATAGRYLGEYLDPTRSTGAYIAPRGMGRMGSFAGANAGIPSAFNAWAK